MDLDDAKSLVPRASDPIISAPRETPASVAISAGRHAAAPDRCAESRCARGGRSSRGPNTEMPA